jgi:ribosomal protein L29
VNKERIKKLNSMKESDLIKERQTLNTSILALRTDIANHKTKGIHRFKSMRRDIARINTILNATRGQND